MAGLSSIPSQPHFAIIRTTSVHIPGDERSRTHPGHGYGEHTEEYITYQAFLDRAEWEAHIGYLRERGADFRAISATPAKVSVQVSVS